MPFDYEDFEQTCETAPDEWLQSEYQRYVMLTSQATTTYAVGFGLAFFTCGLSLIGSAIGMAELANAAPKLGIIKVVMARRKKRHLLEARAIDVFKGIACGSTGLVTGPVGHVVGNAFLHASTTGSTLYHGSGFIPRPIER